MQEKESVIKSKIRKTDIKRKVYTGSFYSLMLIRKRQFSGEVIRI